MSVVLSNLMAQIKRFTLWKTEVFLFTLFFFFVDFFFFSLPSSSLCCVPLKNPVFFFWRHSPRVWHRQRGRDRCCASIKFCQKQNSSQFYQLKLKNHWWRVSRQKCTWNRFEKLLPNWNTLWIWIQKLIYSSKHDGLGVFQINDDESASMVVLFMRIRAFLIKDYWPPKNSISRPYLEYEF